ncbi:MAG: TonB-dependent receptor [Bacteroidota bacterium]
MKCVKTIHPLLLCLFFSYFLPAQQSELRGRVVDAAGEGVGFANVLLLAPADSSLVKGGLTLDDGSYSIQAPVGQSYLLAASMVGFQTTHSAVFTVGEQGPQNIPELLLTEGINLEAVQVVARKPLFEQQIDRLVVNVGSSTTAAGGTALEVLERSPGVIVNRQNNGVSLVGKSGVVIMINGKITYQPAEGIVQMLEGMSADNIERIELITAPSAKYDAEGDAGFINIVLKKRTDLGLNGNFSLAAGYGRGEVGNASLSLNYRNKRLNIFGSYSFLWQDQVAEIFNSREVVFEGETTNSEVFTDRDPIQRNHNVRVGLDYELSEKTVIGFLAAGYDNKWTMDAFNDATTTVNGDRTSLVKLFNVERNQWKHLMGNVNVQHEFRPGTKLNFDLDYLFYEDENPNTYDNDFFDGGGSLLRREDTRSDKFTPINIAVGQLAFEHQFGEKWKYEGGAKMVRSEFTNEVSVETLVNGDWIENPTFTNQSDLQERIYAVYSSADFKANEQNSFKFGLRYEYTDSQLDAEKEGRVVDRQFGSLFPSVFYSRTLNEKQSLNATFTRRISRPTFDDMAPFAIFLDPTTFFFGNAALQPALSNNVKVDYRYESFLFSIQYTYEDSTIAGFQDDVVIEENTQAFRPINLKNTQSWSASATLPFYIGNFWEMQNNANVLWIVLNSFFEGTPVRQTALSYNFNTNQTFKLPRDFSFEASAFYNSAGIFGRARYQPIWGVNVGLQKRLANNQGTLRFNVADLFNSIVFRVGTDLPELGFTTNRRFDFSQRTFRLSYSRTFGNNKLKASRRRGTGSEEERGRVNN